MADVLIRHCTLRLLRHDGWSWGPDPRRLVNIAAKELPQLIAKKLGKVFPDKSNLEITEPLRISLRISLSQLLELKENYLEDEVELGEKWDELLKEQFKIFLKHVGENSKNPKDLEFIEIQKRLTPQTPQPPFIGLKPFEDSSFASFLFSLRERGHLASWLSFLNLPSLEIWHSKIMEFIATKIVEESGDESQKLKDIIEKIDSRWGPPVDFQSCLRLRILSAIELAHQFNGKTPARLLQTLDNLFPPAKNMYADDQGVLKNKRIGDSAKTPTILSLSDTNLESFQSSQMFSSIGIGEYSVSSVLPFLCLGVLHRLGYLEAHTATLKACGLNLNQSKMFAIGLAYKLLDPPKRGWNRSKSSLHSGAIFAGLEQPIPDAFIHSFQRQVAKGLSGMDAVLTQTLIEGHNPNKPLFLEKIDMNLGGGFLLLDCEGIFPIAWDINLKVIAKIIKDFGPISVLIPQNSIDLKLVDLLTAHGIRFVTDAPPTRGEDWRELRTPFSNKFWTNDTEGSSQNSLKAGVQIFQIGEQAKRFIKELIGDRPAISSEKGQELEKTLTLASGVSLATIAWTLFRNRESTDPMLTLERFGNLDARVRFEAKAVKVRLPLGRRYQDLYEHGLLFDVPGVPWLDGRVLEFSGG